MASGTFDHSTSNSDSLNLRSGQDTVKGTGVTRAELEGMLKEWGNALVGISRTHRSGGDAKAKASESIRALYFFGDGDVLFKPTLASKFAFRTDFEGALSYFVGGNAKYGEDRGFALNPWEVVNFDLAGVILGESHGIVMGNKLLQDTSGKVTVANFTMGFVRDRNGRLRINLHHSSLPYQPA